MTKHFTVPGSVVAVLALPVLPYALLFNDGEDALIEDMRSRQASLMESSTAILNKAEADRRDLTAEETKQVEDLTAEFDEIGKQIGVRERVASQHASFTARRGRVTEPEAVDPVARNQAASVPARPVTTRGNSGFYNLGDFAKSVRMASLKESPVVDPRLRNAAASTIGNESIGADGGFAVPPDFRADIMSLVFGEDSLIERTDRMQTQSNTLVLPKDETTPWQTTGGIQSYWTAEGGTKTQSKPALGDTTVRLHTLATLVPMTEELLEDAPAMDSYLRRKAPEKMDFKVSDAIIRGTGVGMPLGILNSPAVVTVAAEGAQSADTFNATNATKMLGRLPVASRRSAAWIIHPDLEAQLPLMTIGQMPVYLPPGGMRDTPYGMLLGRPVIPHQVANTAGDLGDVMLFDFGQYLSATKTGNGRDANGIKTDVSIHLWFDQDLVAFRFTLRVGGQPWWGAPITQRSGANTQSPFVVLAAR